MIISDYSKTRTDLLNAVAHKINATSYLEIGCCTNVNFNNVNVERKVGVDPVSGGTLRMTSDEFFANNTETFDLIFVDGLHHADQVNKDIENSLAVLNTNGVIVMHDCLPTTEYMQLTPMPNGISDWTGDVWKSVFYFNDQQKIDICVVTIDMGCGIIRNRKPSNKQIRKDPNYWMASSYDEYTATYNQLALKTFEEALSWI